MRTVYYGREAWKDHNFDIIAIKDWLAIMSIGEVKVEYVLQKIAKGQYPKILDKIDEFIKILAGSKHNQNQQLIREFLQLLDSSALNRIDPDCQNLEIIGMICQNAKLKIDPVLKSKFDSIRVKKSLPILAK